MPTKKELEAALADAGLPTGNIDALVAAIGLLKEAGDENLAKKLKAAELEATNAKEALETAIAEHKEDLAATPASPALGDVIGSVPLPDGLLIIGDAAVFDQHWVKPQDTRSAYIVDIDGPHAEQLAHRQKQLITEELVDGKWRIHVPSGKQGALGLKSLAEKLIRQNEWSDKVHVAPLGGFTQRALDSVRAGGAGLVAHGGSTVYGAVAGKSAMLHQSADGVIIKIS